MATSVTVTHNSTQTTVNGTTSSYNVIISMGSEAQAAYWAQQAANSAAAASTSESNAASSESAAAISESNAAQSETNAANSEAAAATSEANAQTSENNAAQSELNASNSEAAASTSEANAATSEANALASENAAATSESNALASQSAAATSEANAATSEQNAQTSANNASTSESNAADSASDAEKHAQSEAPFTDSDGVAFDKGAKGWSEDAEAARDEITDKITFADYSDGDLARFDGTKFQPITAADILRDKDVFAKAPPRNVPSKLLHAWDNFNRPNENPITTTDNGLTYNILSGSWEVIDNYCRTVVDGIFTIDTGFGSTRIEGFIPGQSFGGKCGFVIGKDLDNYYSAYINASSVYLEKTIGGVTTVLYSQYLSNVIRGLQDRPVKFIFEYYHVGRFSQSWIKVSTPELTRDSFYTGSKFLEVTSDNATFPNKSDVAFAGVVLASDRKLQNFSISNIEF